MFSHKQPFLNEAAALREAFAARFGVTDNCDAQSDNTTAPPTQMCFLEFATDPVGPFLSPEWAIFLPRRHFAPAVQWIMLNRGQFDVFVHPNSGCEIHDHRDTCMWSGHRWELDLTALHYNCPGCALVDCVTAANATFDVDFVSACGLTPANNGTSLAPTKQAAFCSTSCLTWLQTTFAMAQSCPRFCDDVSSGVAGSLCTQVAKSLSDFQRWETQCDPFGSK